MDTHCNILDASFAYGPFYPIDYKFSPIRLQICQSDNAADITCRVVPVTVVKPTFTPIEIDAVYYAFVVKSNHPTCNTRLDSIVYARMSVSSVIIREKYPHIFVLPNGHRNDIPLVHTCNTAECNHVLSRNILSVIPIVCRHKVIGCPTIRPLTSYYTKFSVRYLYRAIFDIAEINACYASHRDITVARRNIYSLRGIRDKIKIFYCPIIDRDYIACSEKITSDSDIDLICRTCPIRRTTVKAKIFYIITAISYASLVIPRVTIALVLSRDRMTIAIEGFACGKNSSCRRLRRYDDVLRQNAVSIFAAIKKFRKGCFTID